MPNVPAAIFDKAFHDLFKGDKAEEITIQDMSKELRKSASTSYETVRKGMDDLIAFSHLLRRSKSGIVLPKKSYYRKQYLCNRDLKDKVAKAFIDLIVAGTSIACTEGTTIARCVEMILQQGIDVSLVTNNMGVAELAMEDFEIHLTGGEYMSSTHACVGEAACASFRNFRCRTALMGVSGIGHHGELYVHHRQDCRTRRAVIDSVTDSVIIVADSMKLGEPDRFHFADVSSILQEKDVFVVTNWPGELSGRRESQSSVAEEVINNLKLINVEVETSILGNVRKKLKVIETGFPYAESEENVVEPS